MVYFHIFHRLKCTNRWVKCGSSLREDYTLLGSKWYPRVIALTLNKCSIHRNYIPNRSNYSDWVIHFVVRTQRFCMPLELNRALRPRGLKPYRRAKTAVVRSDHFVYLSSTGSIVRTNIRPVRISTAIRLSCGFGARKQKPPLELACLGFHYGNSPIGRPLRICEYL